MTTFRRKNPVNPGYHKVTRTNWGRSSWTHLTLSERSNWLIKYIHANDFAQVKSLLVPNARCPECNADVYFFRHHNGGCAWFNDIPSPWPKHGCMDIVGTKCSAEYVLKQHTKQKKKDTAARRKENAREKVSKLKLKPFAERYFIPVECKKCDRKEYQYELSDSSVRRFTDIGDRWIESDCTLADNGEHERAEGVKYLEDFLQNGGEWKSRVPDTVNRYGYHFGTNNNIDDYLISDENIFASVSKPDHFTVPVRVEKTRSIHSSSMLTLLRSIVNPNSHIIIKTNNSRRLSKAKLAFIRGKLHKPETHNITFLCLDVGKPRKTKLSLIGFVNYSQILTLNRPMTYDQERLERLFEMYTEMTGDVNE